MSPYDCFITHKNIPDIPGKNTLKSKMENLYISVKGFAVKKYKRDKDLK